jgi:hypothetical protein
MSKESAEAGIQFLQEVEGLGVALAIDHAISKDLRESLFKYGTLSDRQVELAFSVQRELEDARNTARAREAALDGVGELVEDRRYVEGMVVSTKLIDSQYGPQMKMLVEEPDGNRLYGSVPSRLKVKVSKGAKVGFTARIKPSDDDPHFGFFSRPTNAQLLAASPQGEFLADG